jgi:hypothetical protein
VLVGLEFGGEREVVEGPAERAEQLLHRGAGAGARIADVDALALQVLEGRDVRVRAGQHRERFRMDGEDGAQLRERAVLGESAFALQRVVLHIGLGHAEIQLALADRIHVIGRAAGRFDRAAEAVLLAVLVDEPADRAADGVVDARHAARADRDELLLRRCQVGPCEQR